MFTFCCCLFVCFSGTWEVPFDSANPGSRNWWNPKWTEVRWKLRVILISIQQQKMCQGMSRSRPIHEKTHETWHSIAKRNRAILNLRYRVWVPDFTDNVLALKGNDPCQTNFWLFWNQYFLDGILPKMFGFIRGHSERGAGYDYVIFPLFLGLLWIPNEVNYLVGVIFFLCPGDTKQS